MDAQPAVRQPRPRGSANARPVLNRGRRGRARRARRRRCGPRARRPGRLADRRPRPSAHCLSGCSPTDAASTDTGALLGRFALVVLIPLAAGVAARSAAPRLARGEPWYAAGSTVAVAALIYPRSATPPRATTSRQRWPPAPPSSPSPRSPPSPRRASSHHRSVPPSASRSACATSPSPPPRTQAFGPPAATVAGIYGVLMLITGALTTTRLRRSAPQTQTRGEPTGPRLNRLAASRATGRGAAAERALGEHCVPPVSPAVIGRVPRTQKAPHLQGFPGAGGGTRTPDTRIMIPA